MAGSPYPSTVQSNGFTLGVKTSPTGQVQFNTLATPQNPPGSYRGAPPPLSLPTTVHSNGWTLGVTQNPAGQVHFTPEAAPPGGTLPQTPAAPGTAAIDPRDATYYQNVAANQFKVNNEINAARLQESQTATALKEALAQLAYQQPRSQLALEERANAQGGLFSSGYGQRQGDLLHAFTTKQTAAQTSANNATNRLTAQIAADQAGVPIYNQGQYLAAALRAAALAAANPATGQPQAVPVGGGGAAKPAAGAVENLSHTMVPLAPESVRHTMVPAKRAAKTSGRTMRAGRY